MAKTSKGVILSQASQIKSDYSFALIKATADNKSLVQDASSAELKVNALVEYSKDSQWDPKKLTSLGFPAGCFLIVDLRGQDIHASDLITNLALVRQYGYQAGVIDDLSTLDDIKALKANQIYLINSGKTNDDQDASLNGNEITDGSGKLAVGMSVKWQRDYTNVDVSGDHAGFVGMGQDTLLKGGNAFGYSTNGRDFNAVITPKGLIFRRPDAERMWRLLKPNEIADINSTVGDKVKKEVDSATAEIPAAVSAANSAVSAAESAVAASKVNSDAIVAQSEAISEAKSAMDSATAEVQQLKANAASDVAQIEATIGEVQNAVNQAKSANESAVQAVQAELKSTSDSMDKVKKRLNEVGTSLDAYAKSAAEQGNDITLIKQKQGQFEADFASAQGNVNQIQADIKGLRQNIKDNQGNIASLLISADKLQASMTDAEKNISNLLLTASKYEQTFKDQDGRLSKVEQTATEHTSELADAKGNIDKVTQKADNLQLLLSDAQKNIQNIQLDAKGLHDTLTGQGNQLASLDVTLNNLDSKYSGITGDLQSKQTALSTEQQQTKDMLLNKADKSEVDNVKGTVNQVSAEQKTMADQINQKVSSVEYQTLKDKVNGMKVGGRNLLIGTSEDEKSGKAYAFADYQISGGLQPNKTYTLSGWARVDQDSLNHHQNVFVDAYSEDWSWSVSLDISSSLTSQYNKITFTTPSGKQFHPYVTAYLSHPDGGTNENNNDANSGMAFIKKLKLEEGNFDTDYLHAPEDTVASIQKNTTAIDENSKLISLMAKQTDVDNIKGTAQQISSRLDVMADQIKSKVTSTDVNNIVDGKGYATTSTVQSLITQTAGTINESITNLDAKYNATVTQVQSLTASIDGLQSNVTNFKNDTSSQITQLSNVIQSKVSASDFNALKDEATWKSTDSIDLNTAVLQQKIFVKGGSNLPPGDYWWYVQVEPGYDSRIVQYAVSDRDNIHYSRQYDGSKWSAWSQGATESEITQLRDDINLRVKSGDLLSQINLTAGNTLIQSNKLYLDASSVVITGTAFIPSAAIAELDADKLTFYGNGSKASIGAGIVQYDQDKIKSTINLQYQGGFEIHSSNQLGSILTMHDNTVRLAVKSNGMANPNSPTDQYSGFYASTGYSLMNSYLKDGTTSGISIGSTDSGVNKDYRIHVYDGSNASNNLSKGISISTSSRFDVYAGNSQLFLGPDKAELRGNDHATVHGNDHTFIEGGNQQIYMHNGEVNIGNPNDTGNATGVHFQVFGWASFNGYVEGMGWTTKSTLSSKTRIEKLDTEDALNKIMSTDLETYQYKTEVAGGMTKRHAGPIIDDVHDVAQYSTPDEFINERRTGRSDADVIGYLMGAVQELKKQLDKVKEKINYE